MLKKSILVFQICFVLPAIAMDDPADNQFLLEGQEQESKYCTEDLNEACSQGDLAAAKSMIEAGIDINLQGEWDWTPLHKAVFRWHYEIIKLLIDSGANVNAIVWNEGTPLHLAAGNGWAFGFQIVKLLIDSGANVNAKDSLGHTPLYQAADCPYTSNNVRFLLEHGATVSSDGKELHNAINSANYANVFLLITHIYQKDIEDIVSISKIENDKSKVETKFNLKESIKRRWLWRAQQLIKAKTGFGGTTLSLAEKHEKKSLFGSLVRLLENIQNTKDFNDLCERIQESVESNINTALKSIN